MMNWLRRVDPAFYTKEPHVLRAGAQIPRYSDEAQVELRLRVVHADRVLYVAAAVVMLSGYALITIPIAWTRIDVVMLGVAALVAVALCATRGRLRSVLLVAFIAAVFGAHAHPVSVAPLVGIVAAGVSVVGSNVVAREWRARPQVITWATFAALLVICAYTIVFNAEAVKVHLLTEIVIIAVAYLSVCVIAGRIRRAELLARPDGVLSLPQSIVPLLDRSHDHAVICWFV
jgi:hypothetical protein